jgi:hypothetical protein
MGSFTSSCGGSNWAFGAGTTMCSGM